MTFLKSIKIGNDSLTLTNEGVKWEKKFIDCAIDYPKEIRYGVRSIQLDIFTIGTEYKIELRDSNKNKIAISLKSYLGFKLQSKYSKFDQVCDLIWDQYFAQQYRHLLENWKNGQSIKIDSYAIDYEGIHKDGRTILFSDMEVEKRSEFLVLNSRKDSRLFMNIEYLRVWNWPLLDAILNEATVNSKS